MISNNENGITIQKIMHSEINMGETTPYVILKRKETIKDSLIKIENISREDLFDCLSDKSILVAVKDDKSSCVTISNAFISSIHGNGGLKFFTKKIKQLDLFFVTEEEFVLIEIQSIYSKLKLKLKQDPLYLENLLGEKIFLLDKEKTSEGLFTSLQNDITTVDQSYIKYIKSGSWKMNAVIAIEGGEAMNNFKELLGRLYD